MADHGSRVLPFPILIFLTGPQDEEFAVLTIYLKMIFLPAAQRHGLVKGRVVLVVLVLLGTHSVIFRKFPQKCAPSVDRFKPIRERLQKNKKVKANAQGYSHLPTHLMVPTYRSNTNLFKKISLGTQIFIFCQI